MIHYDLCVWDYKAVDLYFELNSTERVRIPKHILDQMVFLVAFLINILYMFLYCLQVFLDYIKILSKICTSVITITVGNMSLGDLHRYSISMFFHLSFNH